jgi:cellulose biosynthesis protein BcsQ
VSHRGSLVDHIRATDYTGLHIVPADFSLRHLDIELDDTKHPTERLAALLDPLDDRYDVAILDCPPGVTLASESVFVAVDALLVPTIPSTLSKRTLDQLNVFLAEFPDRPTILPFASMVDRRKKLQRELAVALAELPGFLATAIPNASIIEQMGVERAPLAVYAASSPAAKAFASLWAEIAERLWV